MSLYDFPGRFGPLRRVYAHPGRYPAWRCGRLWSRDEGIMWELFTHPQGLELGLSKGLSAEGFQRGSYSIQLDVTLIWFVLALRLRWPFPTRTDTLGLHWSRWARVAALKIDRTYY
jgi:hypothetical protein